jgi:hypothetical protein
MCNRARPATRLAPNDDGGVVARLLRTIIDCDPTAFGGVESGSEIQARGDVARVASMSPSPSCCTWRSEMSSITPRRRHGVVPRFIAASLLCVALGACERPTEPTPARRATPGVAASVNSGAISSFTETFDATGAPDPTKWVVSAPGAGAVTQASGELRAVTAAADYVGVSSVLSVGAYDLTNDRAYVRLLDHGSWGFFAVLDAEGDGVGMRIRGDILGAYIWQGGTYGDAQAQDTYDPVANAWLAIEHVGGNLLLRVAPDAGNTPGTWVTKATIPVPANMDITAIRVYLANQHDYQSTDRTARFDGLNTVSGAGSTPPGGSAAVLALAGPTISSAQARLLGGAFAKYEDDFDQWSEYWWSGGGASQRYDNYYDRALAYYVAWVRTGDPKYRTRADSILVAYRTDYLEANGYGASPQWTLVAGLELHYRLTGDTLSRRAIAGTYMHGLSGFYTRGDLHDLNNPYMENRIQARTLQTVLAGLRTQGTYAYPPYGWSIGPADWAPLARDILDQILSTQSADGSWHWAQVCGGQLNYMVGMLNDVLIEYHRDFEQDPRILPAVKKAVDFLWANEWDQTGQAFHYLSVHAGCAGTGGNDFLAGDLNGLLVNGFAWVYHMTGDASYKTKADAIFAGLVNNDAITGGVHLGASKQFNQQYSVSYRYLGLRQ